MTHYMELLATNQPWNLILFMAIPVILAETLAIAELYLLFTKKRDGKVQQVSKIAGILAGVYFLGIFLYLFKTAVIPLTANGEWRGFADVLAVGSYLSGVVPLGVIALLELGLLYKKASEHKKHLVHAAAIGVFLVVAHVAMIFGMLSPKIMGWQAASAQNGSGSMNMSMDDMTASLKSVSGDEFDKKFIEEMMAHHQGAIDMAKQAQKSAKHQEIKDMANQIISAQQLEIDAMHAWQKQWGYMQPSSDEETDMMHMHGM